MRRIVVKLEKHLEGHERPCVSSFGAKGTHLIGQNRKVVVVENAVDLAVKTVVHQVSHADVAMMHVGPPESRVTCR
jgi:hypothetical protein